ncbi:MAG: DUF4386 domain-containing protein [Devosia sp.]|nr:DUF4386 domain-containing protein [Devosia sp.]
MSTVASTYSPAAGAAAGPAGATRAAQKDTQLLARLTGLFFLLTYATSIPPVLTLYVPALSDPAFVLGGARDMGLTWGAILEILLILFNIASAVAIYPVLKRRFPVLSLAFVSARIMESAFIAMGIVAVLALGTLRLHAGDADPAALTVVGQALVAIHDWTFKMGPGVVVGFGNGIILGYMMWKTRLLPRFISILGLIGGPALLAGSAGVMLGYFEFGSTIHGLTVAPEFLWELTLGIWLLVRGFTPSAVTSLERSGAASTAQ